MVGQGDAGRNRQRDALVGRAEQDIEFSSAIDDCLCIETTQPCEVLTGIEQPGIEKVRAGTP